MKNTILGSATALILLTLAVPAFSQTWHENYDKAVKVAKKTGKPILADFTGSDWCGWCIRLKDEVFSTDEFKTWAEKNVVLLELDFPRKKQQDGELKKQNAALAKKFGIRGYPTILFLDAEGKELGRSGYKKGGPAAWTQHADGVLGAPKSDDAAEPAVKSDWLTSYAEAVKISEKTGKPILADFTGSDWCGWCIRLDEEVFSKKEFADWAKENVVLLKLDFPRKTPQSDELKAQNAKLRDQHEVKGYPTILILDATGKRLGKLGYQKGGPAPWIKLASRYVTKNG